MHRLFFIIVILLFLTSSNMPITYAEEENQDPPIFVSPQKNIFIPRTTEQKQTLDNLMQLYKEDKIQEAEQLEEQILNNSTFEKLTPQENR